MTKKFICLSILLVILCSGIVCAKTELGLGNGLEEIGMSLIWEREAELDREGVQIPKTGYDKDVARLSLLGLLPNKEVNWDDYATWQLLSEFLTKLNMKKPGLVPNTLTYRSSIDQITYFDAASVLVDLVSPGEKKELNAIKALQKSGIKIKKSNIYDYLTNKELAHLFFKTLQLKQNGQKKSILEDVYISKYRLIKSKILMLEASTMEMEYQGSFIVSDQLIIFQVDFCGNFTPISYDSLTVGMDNLYLIVDDTNVVQTIIVVGDYVPEYVRVLISSSLSSWGSSYSYDFSDVRIASDKELKVVIKTPEGDQIVDTVLPGTIVTFTSKGEEVYYNGVLAASRVFVENTEKESQTTIYSTTRKGEFPIYDGNFEIIPAETEGYLYLINELAMRDYLHRVVPSEMPGYWDVEALKAQAVAARSYAYNQIFGSRYETKSANIDDSTNCQVYNNLPETANVIAAVDGTEGIIMTHNDQCITAFYCSTSSGYTANNEEVWHDSATKQFPGTPLPYVRAKKQIPGYVYPDFTDEIATLNYFREAPIAGYDYISPWYRWHLTLSRTEFETTVSKNLVARENADKILGTDFVQTIAGPEPLDSEFQIGTLEEIRVIARGEGGNILNLEIRGSNGVWRVLKEYNIRFVIRPHKTHTGSSEDVILYFHNGGTYTNYSILPSAFAAFDTEKDQEGNILQINIFGGGNGHGVGMSQWGARGMATQGLTYDQILQNFYTDIELLNLW